MRTPFALVLGALLTGCTWQAGQWPESYPPAQEPAGLRTELRLDGSRRELDGELLAIDPESLLILQRDTVFRISFSRIGRATFPDRETLRISGGQPPTAAVADTLRLLSRFPQGVDDRLLNRLLEAYGGDRVHEIGGSGAGGKGTLHPGPDHLNENEGSEGSDSVETFVVAVREATARFRDRHVAIREGYRRLGPDFPAMGEHWIQPGLVIDGRVDPTRPPVLSYATLEGRTTLTGVAYTLPLGPGEEPPPFLGHTEVWHDHSSRVDEESLLLNHRSRGHGAEGSHERSRLAMVHVWAWTENPAGVLAQHNWALPFRRVGLSVPPEAPAEARRALSLAGEGTAYYVALLDAATEGAPDDQDRFRQALETHGARVDAWVRSARSGAAGGEMGPSDLAPLVGIWRSLWQELEDGCAPQTRVRLSELRDALEG